MSDVIVALAPAHDGKTKEETLTIVDEELVRFSSYMSSLDGLGKGPLSSAEKALVKTYIVAKLRGKI